MSASIEWRCLICCLLCLVCLCFVSSLSSLILPCRFFFLLFFFCSVFVFSVFFFFSSRRRHTRCLSDWSSDVCSSDLDVASGKELARLREHRGPVRAVACAPDGSRFASASLDGTVRLWDAAGRVLIAALQANAQVYGVAFSPDGSQIVAGAGDGSLCVWSAEGQRQMPRRRFRGAQDSISSVAWSANGEVACGGLDGTIRLWDVRAGSELLALRGHEGEVWSVAFSPDGSRLVSGGADGTVRLWDAQTGRELARPG